MSRSIFTYMCICKFENCFKAWCMSFSVSVCCLWSVACSLFGEPLVCNIELLQGTNPSKRISLKTVTKQGKDPLKTSKARIGVWIRLWIRLWTSSHRRAEKAFAYPYIKYSNVSTPEQGGEGEEGKVVGDPLVRGNFGRFYALIVARPNGNPFWVSRGAVGH